MIRSALLALLLATPAAAQTTVTAGGHPWAVAYADWFAIEGAWAVDLGLAMREDFSYDTVPFEQICDELLAQLPGAPPGIAPDDLFRLSINLLTPEGPAFETAIPLAVKKGACRLVVEGDTTHATYPAPLASWTLDDLTIEGEGGRGTALFVPIPGVADAGSFPLDAACRAVLAERFVPVRDLMRQLRPTELEVKGRTGGTEGSIDEAVVSSTFDISDGTCRDPVQ